MTRPSVTPNQANPRRPNARGEGGRLRADIVQAAVRLLEEQGSATPLTLRGVAREAGISAPAIYAHFAGPPDILAAVVADAFDDLVRALRASREGIDDPVERLLAQCHGDIRFARDFPGRYHVLFGQGTAAGAPARSEARSTPGHDRAQPGATSEGPGAEAFRFLVETLVDCIRAGRSASTDPFTDAVALWSALHGYLTLGVATPDFPWPDERHLVDGMVRGQARIRP